MSSSVQLYVYDLSQGMARIMSRQLTGRHFEAIYHTAVVVYGTEYYFGQGIMESRPGQTHHGVPLEVIPMGQTEIPREMFLEYLQELKQVWTADKYHLLDNNCNTFSNELCNFLVGKDIPPHITGLPAEFLNTPFGQSLRPMLEGMFGPSQLARSATAAASAATRTTPGLSSAMASLVGNVAAAAQSGPAATTALQTATNLAQFNSILASHRCVVVDFTSQTCPPCRIISPEFERLVAHLNSSSGFHQVGMGEAARSDANKIVGVKVEVGSVGGGARDIAAAYQITATPTFAFFLDGKKTAQFSGADRHELKTQMDLLLWTAYPPHPHAKIAVPTLDSMSTNPILFTRSSSIDAIFAKLQPATADAPAETQRAIGKLQTALKRRFESDDGAATTKAAASTTTPAALDVGDAELKAMDWMLVNVSVDNVFPALDILRMMVLDTRVRRTYVARTTGVTIISLLSKYGAGESDRKHVLPKAVRLMVLRLACNFFADAASTRYLLSLTMTTKSNNSNSDSTPPPPPTSTTTTTAAATATPHRTITTALLIDALLADDAAVRKEAAALAFNIAAEEARSRRSAAGVSAGDEDVGIHEEWLSELVAALGNALVHEEEDEIEKPKMTALAHFVRFATEPVLQLAAALAIPDAVDAKRAAREESSSSKKLKTQDGAAAAKKRRETIVKLCNELTALLRID
ncbi:hypothetical protein HDU87_001305 [Geranomyces variabilis]|uniref:Uncharacterized protein n=1 Tax=Geranomyces variabilis TaxID=109894 RepID=A0AAD5XRZ2_9FUNG|nr:hypothetical protein HDU87_001305 [Geranomyces variabilis]